MTQHESYVVNRVESLKFVYSKLGEVKTLLRAAYPHERDYLDYAAYNQARVVYNKRLAAIVELQKNITQEAKDIQANRVIDYMGQY